MPISPGRWHSQSVEITCSEMGQFVFPCDTVASITNWQTGMTPGFVCVCVCVRAISA